MQTLQGDGGVWVSISELAHRKGVSRQSAKERVDRLVGNGLIETRSEGRKRLVDLAAYDRAVGEAGDGYREQGAETRREIEPEQKASPALRDAQTEKAKYDARLKALELAEALGRVVSVKKVEQAMVMAAGKIVRAMDDLPMQKLADIEAAAKIDTAHLRRALRSLSYEMRKAAADALSLLPANADGDDEIDLTEID